MIEYVTTHYAEILIAVSAVVAAASAIANLTPTDSDNKAVAVISKIIGLLALNFKK